MRIMIVAVALAAVSLALHVQTAEAAKSKMGCEIGSEVWDATAGKCVPGKPKYSKKSASKTPAKAAKKAPAKK